MGTWHQKYQSAALLSLQPNKESRAEAPENKTGYERCSRIGEIASKKAMRKPIHKSGQASTREPADIDLQGASFLDPALVNGKRVNFHLVDLAGSIGVDVMIVDPTAPSYIRRGLDEARVISDCEVAKRNKHVLNGATMVPLVITTFGKLGPSAQGFLQSLANFACSTGCLLYTSPSPRDS